MCTLVTATTAVTHTHDAVRATALLMAASAHAAAAATGAGGTAAVTAATTAAAPLRPPLTLPTTITALCPAPAPSLCAAPAVRLIPSPVKIAGGAPATINAPVAAGMPRLHVLPSGRPHVGRREGGKRRVGQVVCRCGTQGSSQVD